MEYMNISLVRTLPASLGTGYLLPSSAAARRNNGYSLINPTYKRKLTRYIPIYQALKRKLGFNVQQRKANKTKNTRCLIHMRKKPPPLLGVEAWWWRECAFVFCFLFILDNLWLLIYFLCGFTFCASTILYDYIFVVLRN